jgi:pyruvate formate lyase activating enzyme
LQWLKRDTAVWFELTNLMIPGENDSPDETAAMCDWITRTLGTDVPVHFTAFHPDFRMMDTPPTPPDTLLRAREIALSRGIRYAYTGNIHHSASQTTYCPACGATLIERDGYELGRWALKSSGGTGGCASCGETIPGVFEPSPGRWGNRRQRVRIESPLIKLGHEAPSAPRDANPTGE